MSAKISALPAATAIANADIFVCVQSSTDKQVSRDKILTGKSGESITLQTATTNTRLAMDASDNLDILSNGAHFQCWWNGAVFFIMNSSGIGITAQSSLAYAVFGSSGTVVVSGGGANTSQFLVDTLGNIVFVLAAGASITLPYLPGTPTDWNATPPADVWAALDRCATLLRALNGGVGP